MPSGCAPSLPVPIELPSRIGNGVMLALYGTHTGVNLARKHIGWYTKGLPGSAELRNKVNQQDDPAIVVRMLQDFYSPWLRRTAA